MKFHGITLEQGSTVVNLTVASGTAFPNQPHEGELFFRSDEDPRVSGLHMYANGSWDRIASTDSLTVPKAETLPALANEGDLFYLNSNDTNEGLYIYKNTQWANVSSGTAASFSITGDVTGTIDGGTDTLTLSNSGVSAGTYRSVTVDAKGRVTAGTNPTTLSGYGITDAQPLDADLTSIAAISGTSGLLRKSAENTWALDTNTYLTGNQTITVSGDATGSGTTSISIALANSGVSAGTYRSVTVDAKGRVTAGTNPTTLSGYGITDAQPLDSDLTALAGISSTGIYAVTGQGTSAVRTIEVSGVGLSISNGNGVAGNPSISSNATSSNTVSTVVARDSSGNFSAGTITANLTGTVTGASSLNVLKAGDTMTGSLVVDVSTTTDAIRITQTGTGNALVVEDSTNPDATPFVVDAAGRVLIGATSTVAPAGLQLHGMANEVNFNQTFYGSNSSGPGNGFRKSRGTSIGSNVIVQSGDTLGTVSFQGADGTGYIWGSAISSFVDGQPATGSIPAMLAFYTLPVGGSAVVERLRIASSGAFGLSGANFGSSGQVLTSQGSSATPIWTTPTTGTVTSVGLTAPAAGITVSGSPITSSGSFTLSLADDLAAVESLTGTGIIRRTDANTWTAGTAVSLTSEVTGTLPIANGGTNATTAAGARTSLGLAIGTDVQAWDADLDAIAAIAGTTGLLRKTAANTWSLDTNSYLTGNQTVTLSGDATGSGATAIAVTLANSGVTAGSYGTASSVPSITFDAKGRATAASNTSIAIAASQVTSGTFADARIAQSSVTQHQAALTVAESQITDGVLLTRVGADETITGTWTFNNPVTVGTPFSDNHAATKQYVDNVVSGLDYKQSVRAATTQNITMSGTQTIDGVSLSVGNRVLVKNQTTASQNGIYVVASGAWSRSPDANSDADVTSGMYVFVEQGTTQADSGWILSTEDPLTLGVTELTFMQFNGLGQITAGAGLTKSGNTLDIGTASAQRIVVNADTIDLATVGTAGTYRSVTTDAYGRVTAGTNPTTLSGYGITDAQALDADLTAIAALTGTSGLLRKTAANTWSLDTNTYLTGNQTITLSGDATGSGTSSIAVTLANSGVTAGTYNSVTVDAKGRVTSGTNSLTGTGTTYVTNTSPTISNLTLSGTTVLPTGAQIRTWSASNTDIDGLISGTTAGILFESPESFHFTVGLRSNDTGDGFQVISKGAATAPGTDPYNLLAFEVKATGDTYWAGNATSGGYLARTTVNGNSAWMQQDGTGRSHWYWNTYGGTSPTFTNASEDASALTMTITNNGNGGSMFHRSASGVGKNAGDAISWTTTLYTDLNTLTWKGNVLLRADNFSSYALPLSGGTLTGALTVPSVFTVQAQGTEGGEIHLVKGSAQTSLAGNIVIDTLGTAVRIFENGGSFRNFTLDLTTGALSSTAGGTFLHSGNYNSYSPTLTGTGASGTWGINITGNSATSSRSLLTNGLSFWDSTSALASSHSISTSGSRTVDLAPNTYSWGVFAEFKLSSLFGFTGSYTGLITIAPWAGTTASTGDSSYQLALHPSATNSTTNPSLKFRAGIDSTWGSWNTIWHSGNDGSGSGLDADTLDGIDSLSMSRLVCTTQTGGIGAADGANTWAKIATFSPGTTEYIDCTLILGVTGGWTAVHDSAIISVFFRTHGVNSNPTVDVRILSKGGIPGSSMIANDSFKVISGGWSTAMELWVKKGLQYSGYRIYELSRTQTGGTLAYSTSPGWQAAEPAGAVNNVKTDGITHGLKTRTMGSIGVSEVGGTGDRLLISSSGAGAIFNQNDNSGIFFQTQGLTRLSISDGTGNLTAQGTVQGTQLISTVANGTAPLTVSSFTQVTNLNADLLDGYHAAIGATGNTVVVRDSAGYTYATYFNQSSGLNENPTISQVMVTSSSDGFMRKASIAHLTSSLSGTAPINITGSAASCTTAASATSPVFTGDSVVKDNITTRTDTGFYETSTGTTAEGWPVTTNAWQHLISCTHSNDANYYAMQIAASYYDQNWYFRNTNGSGTTAWSTMLHSGNFNSFAPTLTGTGASGSWNINAATVGTLSVHTGINNEANKIVRTDGNGYIQAGWINTSSGDNGTTAIDRVYASSDSYLRYYTPANFRTVLDVPTRTGSGASGSWNINAATVTNGVYTTGDQTIAGAKTFSGSLIRSGAISSASWTTDGIAFNSDGNTFTDTTSAASAVVSARVSNSFRRPTFASSNAITVTDAATVYILNSPNAGTNTTITNAYSLWVANGVSKFDGITRFDANNAATSSTSGSVRVTGGIGLTGALYAGGDVTAFSDRRVKGDLQIIDNALEKVSQLNGYTYTRIDHLEEEGKRHAGVVAQEVEEVLPEVVTTDPETGLKGVAYGNMVALLIESIKELSAKVNSLQEEIDNMRSRGE